MVELVIIGNGFDKAHNLKTNYKDFMTGIFDERIKKTEEYSNLFEFRKENGISFDDLMKLKNVEITNTISSKNNFFMQALLEFRKKN